MESHPIAVAQVGANSVKRNGRDSSLSCLLREALRLIETENSGMAVEHVASALAGRLWSTCESGDFNLWVLGFEQASGSARIFRVGICKSAAAHGPLVESSDEKAIADGSGKAFVNSICGDLYAAFETALKSQQAADEFTFGGHWHSLAIQGPRSPAWTRRPRTGTLGIQELLEQRDLSCVSLSAASPQEDIRAQMKQMKNALSQRAQTEGGKRPRTIGGCMEHWERSRPEKNPPNWNRVFRLVAIGDEANIADADDVSDDDAVLYATHVQELTASLPSPL
ncbi:hypothetical protein LOC68_05540 [Blastopirellula sp. JC732]|uniref:Uncharacterized protein n=1 Tax=Blastopirellula sediminis TaxID=2894196 RepID=A0A9X1SFS8_9BACT|nr:hypothetical protein [Blastopirellula sediminis]MCC9609372.1 hypothetical protein [Blastopirellula sediminis]MCC9627851.1 hypothetical protein [Blastopirellula sediminis]